MKKKQIIGLVFIVIGVGALSYLYNGYYLAYQDAMNTKKQGTKTTK
jgi:hypothetical protein